MQRTAVAFRRRSHFRYVKSHAPVSIASIIAGKRSIADHRDDTTSNRSLVFQCPGQSNAVNFAHASFNGERFA